MKKNFYSLLLAAFMSLGCLGAKAQGASCEEATVWANMAMIMDGSTSWYTLTPTEPMTLPLQITMGASVNDVVVYEGCDGAEALLLELDETSNTKTYYLATGIEYKIKITPTEGSTMTSVMGTALALSTAPEGQTCMNPIAWTNMNMPSSTGIKWYTLTPTEASVLPINILMGSSVDNVTVYEGCGVQAAEALVLDTNATAKSYYLEGDIEYKIKVTVTSTPATIMGTPLSLSTAPEGQTCMNPIVWSESISVAQGTKWYTLTPEETSTLAMSIGGGTTDDVVIYDACGIDANKVVPTEEDVEAGTKSYKVEGGNEYKVKVTASTANAITVTSELKTLPAVGTDCSNPMPWTGMAMIMDGATKWYSLTTTEPMMLPISIMMGASVDDVVVYNSCDEDEALLLEEDATMNTKSYYLDGNATYLIKIAPTSTMTSVMGTALALSASPEGATCMNPIAWNNMAFLSDDTPKWYSLTVAEASMLPFSLNGINTSNIVIYEGCGVNAAEALILSEDATTKTKSYYLEEGIEYKIKITPETGSTMTMVMGTPLAMSTAPEGQTCMNPIVITEETRNLYQPISANKPTWFQFPMPWAAPVQVNKIFTDSNADTKVTSVLAKAGDCAAVGNTGTELMPNQVMMKAGINLVEVTVSGETSIIFQIQLAATCGNSPQRISALTEGTATTYGPDVFQYYWRFVAPAAGKYIITNQAPEGSDLKVGTLLENENSTFSCDFEGEDGQSVVVGEDGIGELVVELAEGDQIIIGSETYVKIENTASILVKRDGEDNIEREPVRQARDIQIAGDFTTGHFTVTSYLLKEGASVNVYDLTGNTIYKTGYLSTADDSHEVRLNGVPTGTYIVHVIGQKRSASTMIVIK